MLSLCCRSCGMLLVAIGGLPHSSGCEERGKRISAGDWLDEVRSGKLVVRVLCGSPGVCELWEAFPW